MYKLNIKKIQAKTVVQIFSFIGQGLKTSKRPVKVGQTQAQVTMEEDNPVDGAIRK